MERSLTQKLVAEFVGTFTLIFIGAGAVIAVLANPAANGGLVSIAIASGLAVATMVSALGHVSGAHFNPAVTISLWVTQKIEGGNAFAYIVAQLAGGVAGAGMLRVALPENVWRVADLGTPAVNGLIQPGQAVLIEAILTFFLVWVIFATAVDPEGSFGKIAGLAIGFVFMMGMLMGQPFTGGALNPARSFGPALMAGSWTGWWVYWIGPIAGAIIAAFVYDSMILRPRGTGGAAITEDATPAPHGWGAHGEDPDATITNE